MKTVSFQRYTPIERRKLELLAVLDQRAEDLRHFVEEKLDEILPL